ncbi:hypothetical protein JYT88_01915 [Rhodospirillaceae bacterium AH-315-P19]|nr:hypothetical protein [Rhodospirillaceae bacterium AH-315-P19]
MVEKNLFSLNGDACIYDGRGDVADAYGAVQVVRFAGLANPMAQVLTLQGKILQVRDVDSPQTVGYGAVYHVNQPSRIATVSVGYADGYLRTLGNRGSCFVGGRQVPIVGRISMDLITIDVTGIPSQQISPGAFVELIGPHHSIDALAAEAGTIGYELLTTLGRRGQRTYIGGA